MKRTFLQSLALNRKRKEEREEAEKKQKLEGESLFLTLPDEIREYIHDLPYLSLKDEALRLLISFKCLVTFSLLNREERRRFESS